MDLNSVETIFRVHDDFRNRNRPRNCEVKGDAVHGHNFDPVAVKDVIELFLKIS